MSFKWSGFASAFCFPASSFQFSRNRVPVVPLETLSRSTSRYFIAQTASDCAPIDTRRFQEKRGDVANPRIDGVTVDLNRQFAADFYPYSHGCRSMALALERTD